MMVYIISWVDENLHTKSTVFNSHQTVTFCTLTFYSTSSDVTGTLIDFNYNECKGMFKGYYALNNYSPFLNVPVIPAVIPLDAPAFTTNTQVLITSEILEYLYGTNWYHILNGVEHPTFIEKLWSLEDLSGYFKFDIIVDQEIKHPGDTLIAFTNSTRTDTIQMGFTKLSDLSETL